MARKQGSKHHRKAMFCIIAFVMPFVLMEMVSTTLLFLGGSDGTTSILLKKFPAHFRLTQDEELQVFQDLYRDIATNRPSKFFEYEYDPVLAFRKFEDMVWYSKRKEHRFSDLKFPTLKEKLLAWVQSLKVELRESKKPYVIIVLGGSTSKIIDESPNWPSWVQQAAIQLRVREDIYLVSAAIGGFGSLQERILLTEWILPVFEQVGITPNLVVSMDGVNDIGPPILSERFHKYYSTPVYYSRYHTHHQQLDDEITKLQRPKRRWFSVNPDDLWVRGLSLSLMRAVPYTTRAMLNLKNLVTRQPTDTKDPKNDPTLVKEANGENYWYPISEATKNEVVRAFRDHALDLKAACMARGISYQGYLQPIFLKKYHPGPGVPGALPNINYSPLHTGHLRIGGKFLIDWEGLYAGAEVEFSHLGKKFPGSFINLTQLFKDYQTTTNYTWDAMHYAVPGSQIIAKRVLEHNIRVGNLHVN